MATESVLPEGHFPLFPLLYLIDGVFVCSFVFETVSSSQGSSHKAPENDLECLILSRAFSSPESLVPLPLTYVDPGIRALLGIIILRYVAVVYAAFA